MSTKPDHRVWRRLLLCGFLGVCVVAISVVHADEPELTPVTATHQQALQDNQQSTALMAISNVEARLPLGSATRLEATRVYVDSFGETHTRIGYRYNDVPVVGAELIVHTDKNGLELQAGELLAIPPLDTTPLISAVDVEEIVRQQLTGVALESRNVRTQLQIKLIKRRQLKDSVLPPASPTATDYENTIIGSQLVYRVIANAFDSSSARLLVFEIDARDGTVISKQDALRRQVTPPSPPPAGPPSGPGMPGSAMPKNAMSQHSGTVHVPERTFDGLFLVLGRTKRLGLQDRVAIDIRSLEGGDPVDYSEFNRIPPFPEGDNNPYWGNGRNYTREDIERSDPVFSRHAQTAAVDALYGASVTWDLWEKVFAHNGMDGTGSIPFSMAVHASPERSNGSPYYADYFFDYGIVVFPDPPAGAKQKTTPEMVGHELAHGLFRAVSNATTGSYDYCGEFGGIVESNSDVLGTLSEFYASTYPAGASSSIPENGGDWVIGAVEGSPGLPLRYLYKPSLDGKSPDAWTPEIEADCINPHHAAGPLNRMFYYLSKGAPPSWGASDHTSQFMPDGVIGIGINKAAKIWFRAVKTYLLKDSNFVEFRDAVERAAKDLHGSYSIEHLAVQDAFAAVNVGRPADRTAPVIKISVSGPLDNHVVNVSLDDNLPAFGEIYVQARNRRLGDNLIFFGSFSGSSGSLNLGDIEFHTLRVSVTARDLNGNEVSKVVWFDYEAPEILSRLHGDDAVSCAPAGDHHRNTRTCTVKVIDSRSVSHVEVVGHNVVIQTVYRGWPGSNGSEAPPLEPCGDIDGSGCSPSAWPSPATATFEFDISLVDKQQPGGWNYFYVRAYDLAGNYTINNGRFRLAVDEWPPYVADISLSGDNGVVDARVTAWDGTGDITMAIKVSGGFSICERFGEGWENLLFEVTCAFDTRRLPNGDQSLTIILEDQWGNKSNYRHYFTVNNTEPEPEPPPCAPTFYESENNGDLANVVPSCTQNIVGDFDWWNGLALDLDKFEVSLRPGQRLTLTSPTYCADAFLNFCTPGGCLGGSGTNMTSQLTRTFTNTQNSDKSAEIRIRFFGDCQFRNYNLQMSID